MGKRTVGGRKLPAKRENSPGPKVQRKSGSISESISGERKTSRLIIRHQREASGRSVWERKTGY